jgi:N-carbamoyl-L-amino-acid hydrolase
MPVFGFPGGPGVPLPNVERLRRELDQLAGLREPGAPGWTRRAFTPVLTRAMDWVADLMARAGLEVTVDPALNVIGTLKGEGGSDRVLVTGSHLDTVYAGGRFDGPVGVLGALEAARRLVEEGATLHHDLLVVAFYGEEANEFGLSCVGSRAVAGTLSPEHLLLADGRGRTLGDALTEAGGRPDALGDAVWSSRRVAVYLELHVEQGPVLETSGVPLGVVSSISGIHRLRLEFEGRADHAGTTPMEVRRDALAAAAEAVLAVERLGRRGGGVATAGRLEVRPQALNVIPHWAQVWAEVRSPDPRWLEEAWQDLVRAARGLGRRRGVEVTVERVSAEPPVVVPEVVRRTIGEAIGSLGLPWMELPSGAGHDAVQMAHLGPSGMIFVPSRDGRSHCPEEWTDLDHIALGVRALLAALLRFDCTPSSVTG